MRLEYWLTDIVSDFTLTHEICSTSMVHMGFSCVGTIFGICEACEFGFETFPTGKNE